MPDIATGLVAHFNTLAQNVATITRPYDATDRSPHQTLFVTQRARPFVPGPDDPIQPNITVVETRHGPMPCNTSVTDIAPSPVNLNVLSKLLFQYNKSEADFLLGGFTHGFNLHYQGPRQERMAKNLKSAASNPMVVQQKINKEITAGRVAGPFVCRPLQNFVVSPIGLVPKKRV